MTPEAVQAIVQLPPEALLGDDNSRFGLKPSRVESLMDSILSEGRILVPLEVEPLPEPVGDAQYRVRMGHYRREAALRLNEEKGAGLTCPCIIVEPGEKDAGKDLRTLVAENFERQDLTPMDMAVAIKRLLDSGVPKMEVRTIFSRPGGRKGNRVAPASNSFINIMLSFLELPKAAQQKLHNGQYGVTAGMSLVKVAQKNPAKLKEIMATLDQQYEEQLQEEEKAEEKYSEGLKKEEERAAAIKKLDEERAAAAQKLQEASAAVDAANLAEVEAFNAAKLAKEAEARAAAEKAFQEKQAETKVKARLAEDAKKEKEKLEQKLAAAQKAAEDRKAKLEQARKDAQKKAAEADKDAKKKKSQSAEEVRKAAKAAGVDTNVVPLKLQEIREVVEMLCTPSGFPKVQEIGKALKECFAGVTTDRQLLGKIAKIVGEKKEKAPAIGEKRSE